MEFVVKNVSELAGVARGLVAVLGSRWEGAAILCLRGELGAGKTALTQALARVLGIGASVASPTFVLIKNYPLRDRQWPWRRLVHVDCYRLEGGEDLLKLGWLELAVDPANLIVIEWPERVAEILPPGAVEARLEILGETERKISF